MRLYTIPHTGTQFAYRLMYWHMGTEPRIGHLEDAKTRVKWIDDGHAAVTTLRDPVQVALSWLSRGKEPDASLWHVLAEWWGLGHVHFLRVDGDPDAEIMRLARFLGFTGSVDWDWPTNVNTKGDPLGLKWAHKKTGVLPSAAQRFLDDLWADEPTHTMLTEAGYA